MLALVFKAGANTYALDAREIVEIIPVVEFEAVPHAPEYVAGVFNYRGEPVPVIDVCRLIKSSPSRARFSTRVILVKYGSGDAGAAGHVLGLLAESVTDTRVIEEGMLKAPAVSTPNAAYLGDLATAKQGFMQLIRVDELLPAEIKAMLFAEPKRG